MSNQVPPATEQLRTAADSAAPQPEVPQPAREDGDPQEHRGYTSDKEAYLHRLKRIEGQVRGIARMIDEDKYCIDVLTQVSAINKALHAVSIGLLEEHIAHCVVGAARDAQSETASENVNAKVKEASDAISRLLRS